MLTSWSPSLQVLAEEVIARGVAPGTRRVWYPNGIDPTVFDPALLSRRPGASAPSARSSEHRRRTPSSSPSSASFGPLARGGGPGRAPFNVSALESPAWANPRADPLSVRRRRPRACRRYAKPSAATAAGRFSHSPAWSPRRTRPPTTRPQTCLSRPTCRTPMAAVSPALDQTLRVHGHGKCHPCLESRADRHGTPR